MATSYAYDPKGNKVEVNIKDGKSYLSDGSRVGAGYHVKTGGGIYKMGTDGVGTKVADNFIDSGPAKFGDYGQASNVQYISNGRGGYTQVGIDRQGPTSEEIVGGVGGSSSSRARGDIMAGPRPTLRSAQSMADLAGINYNQDYIRGLMEDAVNKQYANLDTEYGRTQDLYYDAVGNSADMYMGMLQRGDRDAVMSGTAGGTQAATNLSSMLALSQESALGATELAQGRSDLVTEREASMAKVATDALKYYNDLGINLMTLGNSELNALVTAYAAEVATEGGIYNTDVLADVERYKTDEAGKVEREKIASQEKMSNAELLAGKYDKTSSSYSGGSGGSYGSNTTTPKVNMDLLSGSEGLYDRMVDTSGKDAADKWLLGQYLKAGIITEDEYKTAINDKDNQIFVNKVRKQIEDATTEKGGVDKLKTLYDIRKDERFKPQS